MDNTNISENKIAYEAPFLIHIGAIKDLTQAGSLGSGNVAGGAEDDILVDNDIEDDGIGDELQIDGDPNQSVPVASVGVPGGRLYDSDGDSQPDFFQANNDDELIPLP